MSNELSKTVRAELCPEGSWKLVNTISKTLKRRMNCLSKGRTSENETRYPTSPAGMRAFLDKFFVRHFFQVQDSLIDYMTSESFIDKLKVGKLSVLDIGCGPAVGSLAILDVISCIIDTLYRKGDISVSSKIKLTCILNDTSDICLGTGKLMLGDYTNLCDTSSNRLISTNLLTVEAPFPANMNQLRRISRNIDGIDFSILSYVAIPLNEDYRKCELTQGLNDTENLCNHDGRVLIVQDQFRELLVARLSRMISRRFVKRTLSQHVYSSENKSSFKKYPYFSCLYTPSEHTSTQKSVVA